MSSANQQGPERNLGPVEATTPEGSRFSQFGDLSVVSRGINMQGDAWCTHSRSRDCYHYVNSNGSIFFQNPDRSKYYWDPRGYSRYTSSDGKQFIINNPNLEDELSRFCFSCEDMGALVPVGRR